MAKLQPNFSWQKYQTEKEDAQEQFQYQMQQEHIIVANTTNSTIDDESFFTRERQTSFTWVNNKPIWKLSLATNAWTAAGTLNTITIPVVGNFTVINMQCCLSNGNLSTSDTLLLPHIDVTNAMNEISIVRNGTTIFLTSGGDDRSAYSGYVTIYYVKN